MNTNKNPLLSGELPIDGKQARSNRILKQFHQKLPFLGQEVKLCEKILRQTTVSIRLQFRCKIVLEAQTCSSIKELKERLGIKSYNTIRKWLSRFIGETDDNTVDDSNLKGFAALCNDKPRASGCRNKMKTPEMQAQLNALIRNGTAATAKMFESDLEKKDLVAKLKAVKNWNYNLLGECLGVHGTTVSRYCRATGLKIKACKTRCQSFDPKYEDKAIEVHSLYSTPTLHRTVLLSIDEKTCIQALQYIRYRIHHGDIYKSCRYTRLGCVHLIAALNPKTGKVYHDFLDGKSRYHIRAFLESLPTKYPELRGCHIKCIMDNLSAHKNFGEHWYRRHPYFEFIFTPTCASWMNQVESFFGMLGRYVLSERPVNSREHLMEDIRAFIDYYNRELKKPFKCNFSIKHHLDQRLHNLQSFCQVGLEKDKASKAFISSYRRMVGLAVNEVEIPEIDLGIVTEKVKRPMEVLVG